MTKKEISTPKTSVGHVRNQCYVVAAVGLLQFSNGSFFGWLSPVLPLLRSNDTPLSTGPMSLEEISWVVSFGAVGSLCGAFIYRPITKYLGCKRTMTSCLAVLSIISWAIYAFGRTKYAFLIARFTAGSVGGGVETVFLLFLSEIADDRIRGALGSTSVLVRHIGSLSGLIVGTYVDYSWVALTFIGFPTLFFIIFLCLPNTAPYLIQIGKHEEAKKSIRFYKGFTGESAETLNALDQEYVRLATIAAENEKKTDSITLEKLRKPAVYRGLLIGIGLMMFNQFCGNFVVMAYGVMIFQEASAHIDPYISSIILSALQLAGTLSSTSLVEILGRKFLLITSMAGCTIGLSIMASYMYLSSLGYDLEIVNWIPVVSLGFVMFISSVGIISLGYLCILESLPSEARNFGLPFSVMASNIFLFISSKIFPILSDSLHLHGVMFFYAMISGIGTIFIAVMIKETKGTSLDDIGEER